MHTHTVNKGNLLVHLLTGHIARVSEAMTAKKSILTQGLSYVITFYTHKAFPVHIRLTDTKSDLMPSAQRPPVHHLSPDTCWSKGLQHNTPVVLGRRAQGGGATNSRKCPLSLSLEGQGDSQNPGGSCWLEQLSLPPSSLGNFYPTGISHSQRDREKGPVIVQMW